MSQTLQALHACDVLISNFTVFELPVCVMVAALPVLYVVSNVTSRGVLYAVSNVGYRNVHPRHLGGGVMTFPRDFVSFTFLIYDQPAVTLVL
jgi:hypothetical protein